MTRLYQVHKIWCFSNPVAALQVYDEITERDAFLFWFEPNNYDEDKKRKFVFGTLNTPFENETRIFHDVYQRFTANHSGKYEVQLDPNKIRDSYFKILPHLAGPWSLNYRTSYGGPNSLTFYFDRHDDAIQFKLSL